MVKGHEKAVRRVAFLLVLALFLAGLGMVSAPVNIPGLCRVYP
jgi:hypothetical protein